MTSMAPAPAGRTALKKRAFSSRWLDAPGIDTERPPQCSLQGKVVTTLAHSFFVAFIFAVMESSPIGLGAPAIQVCAVHIALLLGVWGPKPGRHAHIWVPSPVHEKFGVALFLLIGLVFYVGVAVIHYRKTEQAAGGTFENGTFVDRLWFCIVLLTTVGYGNTFTPTSPGSRAFTLVWSLYGLFIFGASSNVIQSAVSSFIRFMRRAGSTVTQPLAVVATGAFAPSGAVADSGRDSGRDAVVPYLKPSPSSSPRDASPSRERGWSPPSMAAAKAAAEPTTLPAAAEPPEPGPSHEAAFEPGDLYFVGRGLFMNFLAFLVLNIGGSGIFVALEDDFTFADAFYHCIMTSTTIGLGDIAPQTQGGRTYGILHMILSVVLFGSILRTILNALDRRVASAKKAEMLKRQLDRDLITKLDRDGDGVDKAEFVLGMLEALDVLKKSDYEPFLKQFHEFDVSGDGRLSFEDLQSIAQANREKAAAAALAKAQLAESRAFHTNLEQHAHDLIVPTFIACFGFLWQSVWGFILTGSGVCNALAIGSVLGAPPRRATYQRIALLALLAGATQLLAMTLILFSFANPAAYLQMDGLQHLFFYGQLNGAGKTVMTVASADHSTLMARWRAEQASWQNVVIYALYCLAFVGATVLDLLAVRSSMRCLRGTAPR